MARAALYGSSEGRLICLPEAARFWVFDSFSDRSLRSERTLRWIMPVVMRMTTDRLLRVPYAPGRHVSTRSASKPHFAGAVDQHVEHLVHRRHGARGRLVGALE